ncbi:MAG: N-6 DNA methylase [candidate division Zixibacteria bacterium]|nr:N-6 DNA methylase [candidate division Zixibacteria bacterium]
MAEFENLKDLAELNLENPKVSEFINILIQKTADPEANFRDWFFNDVLQGLGFSFPSEFHLTDGKIDYGYTVGQYGIGFEAKPPTLSKKENFFTYKDNLLKHIEEVKKYLGNPELHYLIITDGINWYFFSKQSLKKPSKYFLSLKTLQLVNINSTYTLNHLHINKILDTLRRWEDESYKEGLDEKFFNALKNWMEQICNDLKGQVPPENINREGVNLINKLIFIRTLEDIGSLPFNYLRKEMSEYFHKWRKIEGAKKLLQETNEWIYKHYDTELFRHNNFYISPDLWEFLLLANISPATGTMFNPCLYDFNFANIDFDVLGHVYEQYLAELKRERGIYYTRRFIVEYIINNTIGKKADEIVNRAISYLGRGDLESSRESIEEIFGLKILDPAPGSGSFLICAFDVLAKLYLKWEKKYIDIYNKINEENSLHLFRKHGGNSIVANWKEKIILNCLFGCDIDLNAVGVAKLNLWLRLIRTSPEEYYWKDLQDKNITHALPNLSLNIICENSLLGLKTDEVVEYLRSKHELEFKEIIQLEERYRQNFSTDGKTVEEILRKKTKIRGEFEERLKKCLTDSELDMGLTKSATFWFLEFPFLEFDFVIGNPPYIGEEDHKQLFRPIKAVPLLAEYCEGKMDYWYFFCHLGISLLKENGEISFIVPHYWLTAEGANKLVKRIINETEVEEIFDFNEYKVFKESAPGQHNMVFRLKKTKKLGYPLISRLTNLNLTEEQVESALRGEDVEGIIKFKAQRQDKLLDSSGKLHFTEPEFDDICDLITKNAGCGLGGKKGVFNINQGIVSAIDVVSKKTLKRILMRRGRREPTEDEIQQLEKELDIKRGDGVFVISEATLKKWKLNKRERELIKAFHWAEDIENFYAKRNQGHFIIYTPLEKGRMIESNPKNYPTIKRHLDKLQVMITSDCKPYGLHRARNENIFLKEKIVGVRQTPFPTFAYIDYPYYIGMACNIITQKENPTHKISLKAVTAILNSSLSHFWFYHKGKRKGELLQIDEKPLEDFPLKIPDTKTAKLLEKLVDNIRDLKDTYYNLLRHWDIACKALFGNKTISVKQYIKSSSKPVLTESIRITDGTELLDLKIDLQRTKLTLFTNQGDITCNFENRHSALHLIYFLHYQRSVEKKTIKNINKLLELEIPFRLPTVFKEISVVDIFTELEQKFGSNAINPSLINKQIIEDQQKIDEIVKKLYSLRSEVF